MRMQEHAADTVHRVDLGSLRCPFLGLKALKVLRGLKAGSSIEIVTAGPEARKALARVAWLSGSEVVDMREDGGKYLHLLRRN